MTDEPVSVDELAADTFAILREGDPDIELKLALCTGLVLYSLSDTSKPYLVVHSGPFQYGLDPPVVMEMARTEPRFRTSGSPQKHSLLSILAVYDDILDVDTTDETTPQIGVYAMSGGRVNVTDLALLRYFLLTDKYLVAGAELNRPTYLTVRRDIQRIDMRNPFPPSDQPSYRIGEIYEVNI